MFQLHAVSRVVEYSRVRRPRNTCCVDLSLCASELSLLCLCLRHWPTGNSASDVTLLVRHTHILAAPRIAKFRQMSRPRDIETTSIPD